MEQLTGAAETSLFNEEKGHAGKITVDRGTLIWLHDAHGVESNEAPAFPQWTTEIRAIAQATLDNADQYVVVTRPAERIGPLRPALGVSSSKNESPVDAQAVQIQQKSWKNRKSQMTFV